MKDTEGTVSVRLTREQIRLLVDAIGEALRHLDYEEADFNSLLEQQSRLDSYYEHWNALR